MTKIIFICYMVGFVIKHTIRKWYRKIWNIKTNEVESSQWPTTTWDHGEDVLIFISIK